jgi:L-threonylcarbamoyladenylate synthase
VKVTRDVDEIVTLLQGGGVVGVPTDTVYGLAASLHEPGAMAKLFAAKNRPSDVALPILVDGVAEIERLGVSWFDAARRLSDAFWPGALTIVVPVSHDLATHVGAATDTAGFREPDDDVLRAVLTRSGPLAVSSANRHGATPCTSASLVAATFDESEDVAAVLDAGERLGEVSTIVELTGGSWRVLRQGAISAAAIGNVLAPPEEG